MRNTRSQGGDGRADGVVLGGVRDRCDRRTRFRGGPRFSWRRQDGRRAGTAVAAAGMAGDAAAAAGGEAAGGEAPAIVGGLAAGALLAAPYAYGYGGYNGYGYGGCTAYQPMYDAYGNYIGQQLVRTC